MRRVTSFCVLLSSSLLLLLRGASSEHAFCRHAREIPKEVEKDATKDENILLNSCLLLDWKTVFVQRENEKKQQLRLLVSAPTVKGNITSQAAQFRNSDQENESPIELSLQVEPFEISLKHATSRVIEYIQRSASLPRASRRDRRVQMQKRARRRVRQRRKSYSVRSRSGEQLGRASRVRRQGQVSSRMREWSIRSDNLSTRRQRKVGSTVDIRVTRQRRVKLSGRIGKRSVNRRSLEQSLSYARNSRRRYVRNGYREVRRFTRLSVPRVDIGIRRQTNRRRSQDTRRQKNRRQQIRRIGDRHRITRHARITPYYRLNKRESLAKRRRHLTSRRHYTKGSLNRRQKQAAYRRQYMRDSLARRQRQSTSKRQNMRMKSSKIVPRFQRRRSLYRSGRLSDYQSMRNGQLHIRSMRVRRSSLSVSTRRMSSIHTRRDRRKDDRRHIFATTRSKRVNRRTTNQRRNLRHVDRQRTYQRRGIRTLSYSTRMTRRMVHASRQLLQRHSRQNGRRTRRHRGRRGFLSSTYRAPVKETYPAPFAALNQHISKSSLLVSL